MIDTATRVIDNISDALFDGQKTRLAKRISAICDMQTEIDKKPCPAFLYAGVPYIDRNSPVITARGERPALDLSLNGEMQSYLADQLQVNSDKSQVRQLLFKLLYQANDDQEVFDALPDCLQHLSGLGGFTRQKNHCFYTKEERVQRDMEKTLPKIHYYLAVRLVNS